MNGYTQININDQNVGLKFGYLAIKEFSLAAEKKQDVYYDTVKNEKGEDTRQLSFIGIAKIIHCGYHNNCELKEVEAILTLDDFNTWVESSLSDEEIRKQLTNALEVFASSQYVKALAEQARNGSETEETKKKIVKSGSRKLKAAS